MLIKESVERADNSGRTSFAAIMATFEILKQVSKGGDRNLRKGKRTCFSSIFPVSKSSRKIRTPLLPCRSRVTASSTRLRNLLLTMPNSTCTLDDPNDVNEAARPARVGLSADDNRPRYSLISEKFEGSFGGDRTRPSARLESSDSCAAMLATEVGSRIV